jgi:7-carboxy-7-deazaguanine synthase
MKMTIYKVNNIFYSIEGEGLWAGFPTIFIRMSGCNKNCAYCDEDFSTYTEMTTKEIIDKIKQYPAQRIRITGGEPMLQDLNELLKALYFKCKQTNGTIYDDDTFTSVDLISADIKGPSSGEESDYKVIQKLYHRFKDKTEFKFVIANIQDLDFYKEYRKKIEGANIVLMCDSRIDHKAKTILIEEILKSCPEARYCIRLQCVLGLK